MDIISRIKRESNNLLKVLKYLPHTYGNCSYDLSYLKNKKSPVIFRCTTKKPKKIYLEDLADMINDKTEQDLGNIGVFTNKKELHTQKETSKLYILLMPESSLNKEEKLQVLEQEIIKIRSIVQEYLYIHFNIKPE